MKVKDVIISALNILGRSDIAAALKKGETLGAEAGDTVETLLYCFNATEDELARKYAPLNASEELISPDSKFFFSDFSRPPVRIKRVLADGRETECEIYTRYLTAPATKITVEYEYAPLKKNLDGESDFGADTGEYLLALGAASEYCLVNGEIEAAEIWESKYRREIDGAQKRLPSCGRIPPRRWI